MGDRQRIVRWLRAGILKIKFRGEGICIVYRLIRTETKMLVVVIGVWKDEEVYEIAERRKNKDRM